jgi:hypothetical protein
MGGMDLMNKSINRYRIGICGKKWWWLIFTWILAVSVQNAWQLKWSACSTLIQLDCKREIARSYMMSFASAQGVIDSHQYQNKARALTEYRLCGVWWYWSFSNTDSRQQEAMMCWGEL